MSIYDLCFCNFLLLLIIVFLIERFILTVNVLIDVCMHCTQKKTKKTKKNKKKNKKNIKVYIIDIMVHYGDPNFLTHAPKKASLAFPMFKT